MMELTEYQNELVSEGWEVMHRHNFLYLALETRVGKTPISLTIAGRLNLPILFLTKASNIKDIEHTVSMMAIPNVTVMSFDSLHKCTKQRQVIIADEAHSFGTYPKPSKRAKSMHKISKGCPVIFLSGTPTPESYSQLYHQLWSANCSHRLIDGYKNFYAWGKDYIDIKQKIIGVGQRVNDYSHAKEGLMDSVIDFMVTKTKEDAGFKHYKSKELFYYVPMPEPLVNAIKRLRKDKIITLNDQNIIADTGASMLSKIHQMCSGTVITENTDVWLYLSRHKIDKINEILQDYPRIAIYYKFKAEREILLKEYGSRITEDNNVFMTDPTKIYIGQFVSKREGIDLSNADALVFFNIEHSYLSYSQTISRILNINRESEPTIIFLFSEKGIEKKIYDVVVNKQNYTSRHFNRDIRSIL